ncbi:hypothetical protein SUGI_0770450 [Cryptomeria japonica]|nr:hypothetical protein SUGI_0770450 [Cryptomeria japonica]
MARVCQNENACLDHGGPELKQWPPFRSEKDVKSDWDPFGPNVLLKVELAKDILHEISENETFFAKHGVIGRFRGFWPSLPELHKWISIHGAQS